MKFKHNLKVSAYYIESSKNTSADALSRGKVPDWLQKRGVKYDVKMSDIDKILIDPIAFWTKALSLQARSRS